jgi:nitric oxide reductase NorQ protein
MHEGSVEADTAIALITLAQKLRALRDRGLAEVPSTRLLVATAKLIAGGIPMRKACYVGLVAPLSDDGPLVGAMRDLVDLSFA